MAPKMHSTLNPLGLVCVLSLKLVVLGISAYLVYMGWTGTTNVCEYDGNRYFIWFGTYGIVTVLIGATSVLTSWRPLAMKVTFIALVVGFAAALVGTSIQAFTTIGVPLSGGPLYVGWAGQSVVNGKNWDNTKICFEENQVCRKMFADPSAEPQTDIELDCCRPPKQCSYQHRNGTYYIVAEKDDPDCKEWAGKEEGVCYDCSSCKLGYLFSVDDPWTTLFLYSMASVTFLGMSIGVGEEEIFRQNNGWVDVDNASNDNKTDSDDEDDGGDEENGKLLADH